MLSLQEKKKKNNNQQLHPSLFSGPFDVAFWFVTFTWELAVFQSLVTVKTFCVNYWSVHGIWRSKELKSMVQKSDYNLKGFRRCGARSVVWLRQCPCQIQQKKPLGDEIMSPVGPVACATWLPASALKKSFTGWHKFPSLWEQGLDMLPVSVLLERN